MNQETLSRLSHTAAQIRLGILESTHAAKSGHPGGSLSIAELLSFLYFEEMRVDPKKPQDPDRDRLVLSKGHAAPGLYAALALRGYFPVEMLKTLRQADSILQGHPDMKHIPGVDMSTGSLGQGISAACGMAIAAKMAGKDYRTYTIVGDGESEEGQVWEACMFAAHHKLDNFCLIIDWNGLQIDGLCKDVMCAEPIDEKVKAFGFDVVTVDGNDFDQLESAFDAFHKSTKPFCILMKTVKGKGVSFMENECGWHGKATNPEEYKTAMAELTAKLQELEA